MAMGCIWGFGTNGHKPYVVHSSDYYNTLCMWNCIITASVFYFDLTSFIIHVMKCQETLILSSLARTYYRFAVLESPLNQIFRWPTASVQRAKSRPIYLICFAFIVARKQKNKWRAAFYGDCRAEATIRSASSCRETRNHSKWTQLKLMMLQKRQFIQYIFFNAFSLSSLFSILRMLAVLTFRSHAIVDVKRSGFLFNRCRTISTLAGNAAVHRRPSPLRFISSLVHISHATNWKYRSSSVRLAQKKTSRYIPSELRIKKPFI